MDSMLYPRRRKLGHLTPWGVEYPEFFITICCRTRCVNQLCQKGVGEKILKLAQKYQESRRWHCSLVLLMPDHLHAMIQVPEDQRLVHVIQYFKQACAKQVGIRWQRGFFDHRIRQDESAQGKYRYIEMNPVRSGYVANPENWPWRIQFDTRGKEVPVSVGASKGFARPMVRGGLKDSSSPSGKQRRLLAPTDGEGRV
jgi:REP element-mobilizing transposase RayT